MADTQKDLEKCQGGGLKVAVTSCPRCFAEFLCNAANIQQCQCWGADLGPKEFAYLKSEGFSAQQSGCLCRGCLNQIKRIVSNDLQKSHN